MYGDPTKDRINVGHSAMNDFGAATQYSTTVARAGALVPANLNSLPKPSVGNINKVKEIQVRTVLPGSNTTPLTKIKSSYTFLPQGKQNKAGR
jgi:hypothetical protein